MNVVQRTLLAAGLMASGMTAMAQYPYTWIITGTVTNCYPGQTVSLATISVTSPMYNLTLPVDSNTCTFSATLSLSSVNAAFNLTTLCGGMTVTAYDTVVFGFLLDTAYSAFTLNCGSSAPDCLGVPGGPAQPGTPCNDGNPLTTGDTWDASCNCIGNALSSCNAAFTVQQAGPWTISTTNLSTGSGPLTYQWWMPDGSTSSAFQPGFTFTASGVYGICLTITDSLGCSSWACDTLAVDSAGMLYTGGSYWFDCLGVLFGPAMPGSPCDDGDSTTINDTWTSWCGCAGTGTGTLDCLGIPGGSNLPGTACVDTAFGMIFTGVWDSACVCVANTIDCLGIPGGPNVPGTPCNDGNPLTTNDTWDSSCNCVGGSSLPCNADFWVIQAYQYDSLLGTSTPIPYMLWVWNLTSGGSGSYSYLWDFGDGSTSTVAYPTHVYSGNGPYVLCLTIDDGLGCTDIYCDTVAIDSMGYYTGFNGPANSVHSSGFAINVMASTGIEEPGAFSDLGIAPNPASDVMSVSFASTFSGTVTVSIVGLDGKEVRSERIPASNGLNRIRMNVQDLRAGMYLLRIGDDTNRISQRFVKAER